MTAAHQIKINQGADSRIIFILKHGDEPLDLTGYSAAMQIRQQVYSAEAADTLTSENGRLLIEPGAGKITVVFPSAVTKDYFPGTYVYDLEIKSGGGEVMRLLEGKVLVSAEVTRIFNRN